MEQKVNHHIHWVRLIFAFILFLVLSIGAGYLIKMALANFKIPLDIPTWLAMLIIFGILIVMNISFLPLPFGISLLLVAASHWNPILVVFVGSLGASIGEFNGYLFGHLGKKIAINENTPGYKMIQGWIRRYGMWAIAFLSFQPVLPFEVGGFIAGVTKMPIVQFLPAIEIGKFPKYLILIYLGNTIIHIIHYL